MKTLNKKMDSVPLKPLFELFTSSTCGPCVEANEILDEIFENNPSEYSSIKYQMDWPGNGDPYYTEEGGVRRAYYGVYSVPDLYINSEKLDPVTSITQEIFDDYAAQMTNMEIEITQAFIDEDNLISVEAEISALTNYEAGLTAYLVVVEKKTFNNVGTNGETEFHNVMMKMLPDAIGTELDDLTAGEIVTLSESFDMDETFMETPNDLAVIVFVQDNSDKSVIQSEMVDVVGEFDVYNITYIVQDVNAGPIEGATVTLENYGTKISDENGQLIFEQTLSGAYDYSVNYAGLVPYSGAINVIDEDVIQEISLEHYTSLLESFNSGLPSSWTKHVGSPNFLYYAQSAMKFTRFSGVDDNIMLISPAVEVNPEDTMSFQYGEAWNTTTLSFGLISNPYDPTSYIELGSENPGEEWETYKYSLNELVTSDTVVYFAWKHATTNESSFLLDNVFLLKEGEICLPLYTQGCGNFEYGFTDFILEQIDNSNSGCDELNGKGWSQYFELGPAELQAGEAYTISMATGYENVYASVWIDFNDDFVLSADEMVVDNYLVENPSNMYDVQITIPEDAADGLFLMRARTNGNGLCNDPCEEYYYGEAEDYWILIGEEQILPPTNLAYELIDEDVVLHWDAPVVDELVAYNVYYSYNSGSFELLENVNETTFTHSTPGDGLHQYYITAVYMTGESEPSNTVSVLITHIQTHPDIGLQIYPNPARDIITIECAPEIVSPVKVTIFNAQSCMVMQENIANGKSTMNLGNLKHGVYFARISTANITKTIKLVIE